MDEPAFDDTPDGIHDAGHRVFVGGQGQHWDIIGDLQFEFLKAQGLAPATRFLDVACGSLRLGARAIPFLDRGHYAGLDRHVELIIYGVMAELGEAMFREKRPRFVVSGDFDLGGLPWAPEMAMAQSLFTHLAIGDIERCLRRLRPVMAPGGRFFATIFEAPSEEDHQGASHSWRVFRYTPERLLEVGRAAGWASRYLGEWGHPRGQRMVEFRAD